MCCFFTSLVLFGPRLAGLIWWLIWPASWNLAFNSWIWAILGIIFLPWTTLMYVLVYGANGMVGLDWLWVGLGVLADVVSYGGGGYTNRDRLNM